ncbi:HAMP domain-containing sensor histidine kinase [Oscillospiraceae bacterium WX1]
MKSLYFRNFMMTASIVLLSFLFLGAIFSAWSYRLVVAETKETMSKTAGEVVRYISALSNGYELGGFEMRMALSVMSKTTGFDILVADRTGTVISCSDKDGTCPHIGRNVPHSILSQITSDAGYSGTSDLGGVYDDSRYVVGVPLTSGNIIVGYVLLSSESTEMIHVWRQFSGVFLMISLFVLVLTFFITLITSKKQAEPLNEMALAARRFARGDFTARVAETCRDDELGQLTDAFNKMADSLERSESLRREFVANVSHELKTPMTVISGFSDGILDGTIPQENSREYLEVISAETKRLSRLVRNMLDMSRIQSTSAEILRSGRFDISEIIRLSLLSLGSKIDAKWLDVDAALPEEPMTARGDQDAMTQVVYNLIDNAVKFAAQGSTLRVSLWKQGQRAFVSIENTGETIPPEEMRLIFDRFHKTDRSRSENRDSTGLGLYIVKTILDNHKEDIFVTSTDGVTKFTFTLTLDTNERPSGAR